MYTGASELGVGAAFDGSGNLYVANNTGGGFSKSVIKITSGGSASTFASGFNTPDGLAFDTAGNLYIADTGAHKVFKNSRATTFISLNAVQGLAFDSAGNLYASQQTANAVSEYSSTGALLNANFGSGYSNPNGLAFDAAGNLYVTNANGLAHSVSMVTPNGTVTTLTNNLTDPTGIVFH